MSETQAPMYEHATVDAETQELIDQLVPPRRPRWKVGVIALVVVVVLVLIPVQSRAGVLTARLEPRAESAEVHDGADITLTLEIRNEGRFETRLVDVDPDTRGLKGGRLATPMPITISPGESAVVALHYASYDCDKFLDTDDRSITIRATNALHIERTQDYSVDGATSPQGWADGMAFNVACVDYDQ